MNLSAVTFHNHCHNLEFRLSITGYEFPDLKTGSDRNWLTVKTECYYQDKVFNAEFPCLETRDIDEISNWFCTISQNNIPMWITLSFVEPNIEFELYSNIDGIIRFGIKLGFECKPPFEIDELSIGDPHPDDEFVMAFEYPFDLMKDFGDRFRKLHETFPQRADY